MSEALGAALEATLTVEVLLIMIAAALYGLFVGAMPGLTATMAVALMVPFTFYLSDISGLAAIVTMAACAIFAGDIPGTLMRIPGTPSSAAYVDDAYALRLRGQAQLTLQNALIFSVGGGLLGSCVLILAARQLAAFAYEFSSYEYFWLCLLGLSCAAIVSRGSNLKGALSLILGLLFASIGLGSTHSTPRLTFGSDDLINGISFIPAMIGLFGVSEVLRNVRRADVLSHGAQTDDVDLSGAALPNQGVGETFRGLGRSKRGLLRSSGIGIVIGMLPGAGADVAAWIAYAVSKRFSKNPAEYGQGSMEGVVDASAANNASLAGAWIPALVLGIPGDSVTAIVIGVLLMKNVSPGPAIFDDPQQSVLVYSIYIAFIASNLLLIPLGLLAIRAGSLLIRIPQRVLLPVILLFCILGSYAISGSTFDIGIMLCLGILGFVLESYDVPLGPMVLGIILGGKLEEYFVQCLTKSDSLSAFFERPVAAGLGVACLLLWAIPAAAWVLWRRR